jgi:hypothetical protein
MQRRGEQWYWQPRDGVKAAVAPSTALPLVPPSSGAAVAAGAVSPPKLRKMVGDPDFERCRQQSGLQATSQPPGWYTCLYCNAAGAHFRAVCPRQRPTTRGGPDQGSCDTVQWEPVPAPERAPGLLGRLQADYRAAAVEADRPRAEAAARSIRYKELAMQAYLAAPDTTKQAEDFRAACQRATAVREGTTCLTPLTCYSHAGHTVEERGHPCLPNPHCCDHLFGWQVQAALGSAQAVLEATPSRKRRKRAAAMQRVEDLREELAAIRRSSEFCAKVFELNADPAFRDRLAAPPAGPPSAVTAACAQPRPRPAQPTPPLYTTVRPPTRHLLACIAAGRRAQSSTEGHSLGSCARCSAAGSGSRGGASSSKTGSGGCVAGRGEPLWECCVARREHLWPAHASLALYCAGLVAACSERHAEHATRSTTSPRLWAGGNGR